MTRHSSARARDNGGQHDEKMAHGAGGAARRGSGWDGHGCAGRLSVHPACQVTSDATKADYRTAAGHPGMLRPVAWDAGFRASPDDGTRRGCNDAVGGP